MTINLIKNPSGTLRFTARETTRSYSSTLLYFTLLSGMGLLPARRDKSESARPTGGGADRVSGATEQLRR